MKIKVKKLIQEISTKVGAEKTERIEKLIDNCVMYETDIITLYNWLDKINNRLI